jgi:spore germination protein YaaH
MLSPRAGVLAAVAVVVSLLPACSSGSGGVSTDTRGGFVVVTAGGTALVDGQADVPPTLDLRVAASGGLSPQQVLATLDGRALALDAGTGGALTATVAPMPLGSAHSLVLAVPDRAQQRIAFHVAPPAGAAAALHTDAGDRSTVLDLVFQFAPLDRHAVEAALPAGASSAWQDATHLRAAWSAAPGGTLSLPATLATARGSHLGGTLSLPLDAVAPGVLRRAAVPQAQGAARPLVVAFTVGTAASRASFAAHADRISVVSPTGIHIGAGGSLTGTPDQSAVATAAERGVPVWPLIQNDASDSAGIAATLGDDAALDRLVTQTAALGYPGVHLDIEGVPADGRDHLSTLVKRLAGALHQRGRRLAVAVVPHKPGHLNVFSAAYDLQAISASADLVTLMAYDEHTSSTDPGPVAGLAWDQQVLGGSLAELHSRDTALLGLPLYSRAWDGGDVTADSYSASVSHALQTAGARVDYDFGAQTPSIHYGDSAALWFDDAQSLAAKAALVDSLHLRGVALWRLGFEDPAVWAALPTGPPRP